MNRVGGLSIAGTGQAPEPHPVLLQQAARDHPGAENDQGGQNDFPRIHQ